MLVDEKKYKTNYYLNNDILWRAIKKAQVPACKEPVGLSRSDSKRPDGATLIPWSYGDVCMGRNRAGLICSFDYSHITSTASNAWAAADKAASSKTKEYERLSITHN